MTSDEKYMKLALDLAWKGVGKAWPNPMVGCVIIKNSKIIGKGYHKKFGGPHAEINALKSCKKSPRGATMYVTLEPCCRFGKTPPCTDAIIKAGIKKVVAATKDPAKKANGKGFKVLKNEGIKIKTGICKEEAQIVNAPLFFAGMKNPWVRFTGKIYPWVIVKWAQSKDGFLARTDKKRWITCSKSRKDVHKLRRKAQAVLVGINTILEDDPMLTARPDTGRQPLRVVLDSRLKIPADSNLIKTAKKVPLLIFTTLKNSKKIRLLRKKGAEIATVSSAKGKCSLKSALADLGQRDINLIIIEGGKEVITSFLKQKLADEIIIYTSNEKLRDKGRVKISKEMEKTYHFVKNNYFEKKRFDTDLYLRASTEE
ncbi:MAG: bifunctional diaminohydroxyphosphoribosylaminopyrimidine deaminase/5-amino-6-(5-phosphoribosylamino)uracil reductase RibD [Planctomycetota bacterium]